MPALLQVREPVPVAQAHTSASPGLQTRTGPVLGPASGAQPTVKVRARAHRIASTLVMATSR